MGMWCKKCGKFIGHIAINLNSKHAEESWKEYKQMFKEHDKICKGKKVTPGRVFFAAIDAIIFVLVFVGSFSFLALILLFLLEEGSKDISAIEAFSMSFYVLLVPLYIAIKVSNSFSLRRIVYDTK